MCGTPRPAPSRRTATSTPSMPSARATFGYPTTDETVTSDGRGRFNHFFDPATGSSKSIYWTAQTRAFSVEGLIRGHYAALGWERGLGYPTSDEQKAHDGVGRFHTFERGIIVWHPQTGACAVIGDILARYLAVGGTRYGYPTTDESATPDGRGRFNHFVDVNDGHEKVNLLDTRKGSP